MKVQFAATPIEQETQLHAWGLEAESLKQVALWAGSFYKDCTPLHPKGYKFVSAYAEAGRRLREVYLTRGWVVCDMNNQTAIRNEALKLRLHPCNFDDATADPTRTPKNLSGKGSAAEDDTAFNQLDLFGGALPHTIPHPETLRVRGYTTLLLGMNFAGEFPKAEVSLPVHFLYGEFLAYSVRVPLLDGSPLTAARILQTKPGDAFGVIDIPIKFVL